MPRWFIKNDGFCANDAVWMKSWFLVAECQLPDAEEVVKGICWEVTFARNRLSSSLTQIGRISFQYRECWNDHQNFIDLKVARGMKLIFFFFLHVLRNYLGTFHFRNSCYQSSFHMLVHCEGNWSGKCTALSINPIPILMYAEYLNGLIGVFSLVCA